MYYVSRYVPRVLLMEAVEVTANELNEPHQAEKKGYIVLRSLYS